MNAHLVQKPFSNENLPAMIVAHARVLLVGDATGGGNGPLASGRVNVVQPVQGEDFQPPIAYVPEGSNQVVRQFALVIEAPLLAVGGALKGIEDIASGEARKAPQIQLGTVRGITQIGKIPAGDL